MHNRASPRGPVFRKDCTITIGTSTQLMVDFGGASKMYGCIPVIHLPMKYYCGKLTIIHKVNGYQPFIKRECNLALCKYGDMP
ncbi:MAG: hypothetical protein IPP17_27605 [Bacteroidetes bacterium]|nr:hypothetical protein [Bacteroidota bacterium]